MAHERLRPQFLFDEEKIKQLKQVAPECFEDGKINFETLRQNLGDWAQDEEEKDVEHFGLFWPGKRDARKIAALPPQGTLEPVYGEGLKADGTPDTEGVNDSKNIFIEGENMEVLKILQKSYAGKIKMIYIDPPYNTGKDFVYDDNFTEPLQEYLRRTGQTDEDGKPLTTNKLSDGRFHSKWLSMMYPRIKLAQKLLKEEGVMFISIGDNEFNHLKSLLDEIFGPENFIATFIWNTDGHTDNQLEVKVNHEYILCYQKDCNYTALNSIIDPNTRKESNLHKGFAENSITKNGPKNPPSEITLPKGFPCVSKTLSLPKTKVTKNYFIEVEELGHINREVTRKYNVTYPVRLNDLEVTNYRLTKDLKVFAGWASADKLRAFIDGNFQPLIEDDGETVFYLSSNGVVYYKKKREGAKNILSVLRNFTTTEKTRSELEKDGIYFSYPKPVDLIKYLISAGVGENDIILDFFSGSGTTGHALYELISETELAASFILVQMLENTNEESLAYQKGFKTIPEITKKRLKVFSKKLKNKVNDFGYRYFSLVESNYKVWNKLREKTTANLENALELFNQEPLVKDWSSEGIKYELCLLEGLVLSHGTERQLQYKKNEVVKISDEYCDHSLLVCLDKEIKPETIKSLELSGNDIFICLDNAISNVDKLKLSDKGLIKTI